MSHAGSGRTRHENGDFTRARAEAVLAEAAERVRAARTVAGNCLDTADRQHLLAMLDLPEPTPEVPVDETDALAGALKTYVRAVADAVGVPPEGTSCEVTDTVTAYVALARRGHEHPNRDLMLVWSERQGWVVSVETGPTEPPLVLSCLGGDTVPDPETVARFVADLVDQHAPPRRLVALPPAVDRLRLAERMAQHTR
jgi:Family of unknown function (DUF6292)